MISKKVEFLGLAVAAAFVATGVVAIPASAASSSVSGDVSAHEGVANAYDLIKTPAPIQKASTMSTCTIAATSTWIFPGHTSALTAICSSAASTYSWTGGTCAGLSTASCTVTPLLNTTYTVTAFSNSGVAIEYGEVTVEVSRFSPAPPMMVSRSSHSATLLPNGKVLVAGGVGVVGGVEVPLASTEIYDPVSNSWNSAGSMSAGRARHTATLLLNGKVLVVGGNESASSEEHYLASAQVYDPASNTWSDAGSMLAARVFHAATLLPNGKVLVMGGHAAWPTDCSYNCSRAFSSVEAYDPSSNTWSSASDMLPRDWLTATLLPNGKVLALGAYECTKREVNTGPSGGFYRALETCSLPPQLYDPASNTWGDGAYRDLDNQWGVGILRHTATLLPNGKVFAAGGESCGMFECDDFTALPVFVEIYDPMSNAWSHNPYEPGIIGYPNFMSTGRLGHTATLLPNGRVLVAGGGQRRYDTNSADIYDPTSNTWSGDGRMTTYRAQHTATLLPDGRVLLTGSGSSEFYGEVLGEQTAPERVDLPVDSTAATAPGNKAVVITHGWNASASDWVRDMANDLCANNKIGVLVSTTSPVNLDNRLSKMCQVRAPNNVLWDVWIVDWRTKADTWYAYGRLRLPDPMQAYVNAIGIGRTLATSLKGNNYSHIHLIAHSAGANLIDFATIWLKYWATKENRLPLEIHATFLDAYDPMSDSSRYGKSADWTDNYVDTREVFPRASGLDGTRLFLQNGYNIDVTSLPFPDPCGQLLDPSNPLSTLLSTLDVLLCRHNRPVRFYGLSVDSSFVGDATSAAADPIPANGTGAMGYPLSVENGHSLSSLNSAYPKKEKCVMCGSTCYPGSLPPSFLTYLPSALATTVVDTVTGTVNYVAGVGTTMFNSIKIGAGLISALASSSVQPQVRMSSSGRPMAQAASTTPTDEPSWIVALPTTTQPVNTLRFNWRFAAAGEGFLRVFVDGNLVRELDQRHVPLASTTAEEVYIGGADGTIPAGTHRIAFRLDGFGASASGVELTNVELGLVTVTAAEVAPICNLTAEPASVPTGGISTLTSSCTPTATSYVWTGGTCAGTTAATCTVTPTSTTTYSVAGVNSGGTGTVASASVTVFTAPSSRLINLSTRGQVQTGDNVMIGGFIIGGATPKKVLVRAVGPNLANYGVSGVLLDPSLQLFSGQTPIASNDDWGNASNVAEIQASTFAPVNGKESAILSTLNPGAYTAIVSGVASGTGVGIVEVYELDHPEIPLVNISTRGKVLTGDNVMIGGFIIQGDSAKTVLIRAVGPNLANYGVTGVLANPKLQLYSGQTVIASNDDWGTATNAADITATGLAPVSPLESAILITLQPGAYTAIVSGADGGSGVGIVEVFAQ